jgi:hypothetical protein
MKQHDFDILTQYCTRCGLSAHDTVMGIGGPRQNCMTGDKIVAISHMVKGSRLRGLIRHADR